MAEKSEEEVISEVTEEQQEKPKPVVLPSDAVVIFANPEKQNRVRIGPDEWLPMGSSRMLFSGQPGSGKRNAMLNVIFRTKPPPSAIHIVHCDPETIEYDCLSQLGVPVFYYEPSDFPTVQNIENPTADEESASSDEEEEDAHSKKQPRKNPLGINPLVIVDECPADELGKVGSHRLERLINFVATHRNTVVMVSIQSLLSIPPKARRGFNHYVLWKQADRQVNQMAANRANIDADILDDLFGLCHNRHDFIWLDLDQQHDSPMRYRLNGIYPITFETRI